MKKLLKKLQNYKHSYTATIIASLLVGIYYSLSRLSDQVCTENGMVLAGMIKYPAGTPFYYYNVKVFALINQISALLVWVTQSPLFVSLFMSLLSGMLSCMALALMVYAFCRNSYISIGALLLVIVANMVEVVTASPTWLYWTGHSYGVVGTGIVYPIWLYGTSHTYGIVGLSFMLLILALFGCRKYKWALICTGLAPSIHPSWGMFMALILATGGLLNLKFSWLLAKKYWKYFAIGFGISLAALALQMYWMRVLPSIDPDLKKQYLDSFIRYWDCHRKQFDFSHPSVCLAAYCTILAAAAMLLLKFRAGTKFILGVIAVAGLWSFGGAYISHLPYEKVPIYVLMFMPGRFINLNIIIYPALFIGVLFSRNLYKKSWCVLIYIAVLCLWYSNYYQRTMTDIKLVHYIFGLKGNMIIVCDLLIAILIAFAIFLYCWKRNIPMSRVWKVIVGRFRDPGIKNTLRFLLITAFAMTLTGFWILRFRRGLILPRINISKSYSNDDFYKRLALDEGVLLNISKAGGISMKTKRPVWFDMGALDAFPMVPECAEELNPGMQEIYGVNLLNDPGEKFRNLGILHWEKHRDLWEKRSREDWLKLAEKYNFTGIVVLRSWKLKLNRSAENDLYAYYTLENK